MRPGSGRWSGSRAEKVGRSGSRRSALAGRQGRRGVVAVLVRCWAGVRVTSAYRRAEEGLVHIQPRSRIRRTLCIPGIRKTIPGELGHPDPQLEFWVIPVPKQIYALYVHSMSHNKFCATCIRFHVPQKRCATPATHNNRTLSALAGRGLRRGKPFSGTEPRQKVIRRPRHQASA